MNYKPYLYTIQITGERDGDVYLGFSFNGNEMRGDTDFDELISIAQELKNTLKKIHEVNFSAK